MKRKPNWKRDGMKSNGLYNTIKKSPLTDNPQLSESHIEAISDYISKYKITEGRMPTAAHLNRKYGIRASSTYYRGL